MKTNHTQTAMPIQFRNALLRMMPEFISVMPEGQFIAALFQHAWDDASNYADARRFFYERSGVFNLLCDHCGLDGAQVQQMFLKSHKINREMGDDA